ncbi:MAG TPA: M56 family metallopeptidase [Firmicutes bacterium]|nr:M56 family metallopeptidase [Bacillota bacterium]
MSLFQMSIIGGALVCFIVVVRVLAIHRLPKWTFFVLWIIAALRLLLPLSIPLPFNIHMGVGSLMDTVQGLSAGNTGSPSMGENLPPYDTGTTAPSPTAEHIPVFTVLWLAGVLLLVLYFSISYLRSMRKFRMSIPDNTPYIQNWLTVHQISRPLEIRSSDLIFSPLTYGILRPVILLPKKFDRTDEAALQCVLTHEYVHIRRFDAITKMLFAAVLCIHWFNPFIWVMYVLANQDMELSCDAWVVRMMGENSRSTYALALINAGETRNGISALCSPFSKHAITERIENIMKYKKPALWVIVVSVAVCAVVAVCSLTSLKATNEYTSQNLTFPVSDAEKTDYNKAIFEIVPFSIRFELPTGWSIGEYDPQAGTYLYSGILSRVGIYDQNGQFVGAVGYNTFETDEETAGELMAIYNQIALGNDYQFNVKNTYTVVTDSSMGQTATVDVYYSPVFDETFGTEKINYGILSYDREKSVYVAFEFDSASVSDEVITNIADSVDFY